MGRGRLRNWWSLGAVAAIAAVVAWLLYLIWRSPRRDDWATYGAFAVTVAAVIVSWLARAWQKGKSGQSANAAGSGQLDHVADQLAAAVHAQWKREAEERGLTGADAIRVRWGRPSLPMAGPVAAAAGSRRFPPLPGLAAVGQAELAAGQVADLHALYGGLQSGRLIIAGRPGSGKSGAAVLLLLAALRHREEVSDQDRPRVPVPVLVTAQDWDPVRQKAAEWLTRKLQDTYPLFIGSAGARIALALLAAGRITVIIDGLDEVSTDLRPIALQALSHQATFRLVILSRTREMADAVSQGVLQGSAAVELYPVDPADAASYLERTHLDPLPAGWQDLTGRLRADPASPLSTALDNPLTLTLVRDTYQAGDSIREFLEFCDADLDNMPADQAAAAITDHLLDRVLPVAYTRRPGQSSPPYDLATAQRVLSRIAARMNHDGTRDLNWWQIPAWAPRAPRIVASFIVGALTVGPAIGATTGFTRLPMGQGTGLDFGVIYGLMSGTICVVAGMFGVGGTRPRIIGDLKLTRLLSRSNLLVEVAVACVAGSMVGIDTVPSYGIVVGLVPAAVAGLTGGLVAGLLNVLTADPDSNKSMNPATSWRRNQSYGLAAGLLTAFTVGLVFGLPVGPPRMSWVGFGAVFRAGLPYGLAFGLLGGLLLTASYPLSLASVQLAIRWRSPVRMMRFLNDAHSRNVLRVVGPSYQFRHARLQDRLATPTATFGRDAPALPSQTPRNLIAGMPQQESSVPISLDIGQDG
jgi:hypothetical protein